MTRGERVVAFIEKYCRVPEGDLRGKPIKLLEFQRRFILDIYDNPAGTSRAYLSIGRKNGKSALIACIVLAHIVGPEAVLNSQIVCGARSQKQAGIIFKLAQKMILMNEDLRGAARTVTSTKTIMGLAKNVEFMAISAEAATAHGLSPAVAILDEVGQIKGDQDEFTEAIETAQGAYSDALLIAISTQAATDNDLFSRWLDDAEASGDPKIVSHVYTAPEGCELLDRDAWAAANPAMGEFRSLVELEQWAVQAERMPAKENSFRWLYLNQRIDATAPFVSQSVWRACGGKVVDGFDGAEVFCGLDLSEANDLTAFVAVGMVNGIWHVKPTFWLPGDGLREKAKADRVPYDRWHDEGWLKTTPGPTVDFEFLAAHIFEFCEANSVVKVAFDRWKFRHLKPWLVKSGFSEADVEGDGALFEPFGQGYQSMSPALRDLEVELLNKRVAHGDHPVLEMCARNATVQMDPTGNRKLSKAKSHGRIDGMVALAMAMSVAGTWHDATSESYLESEGLMVL